MEALEAGAMLASADIHCEPHTLSLRAQEPSWLELDEKARAAVLEDSAGLISPNRSLALLPVIQPLFSRVPTQASPTQSSAPDSGFQSLYLAPELTAHQWVAFSYS